MFIKQFRRKTNCPASISEINRVSRLLSWDLVQILVCKRLETIIRSGREAGRGRMLTLNKKIINYQ